MTVRAYMVEIEFDGTELRARGTNKASHVALAGAQASLGDVVLPARQIREVTLKRASAMVNGRLTVTAFSGWEYPINFRKKQAADVEPLAAQLEQLAAANRADPPEIEWRERPEPLLLRKAQEWVDRKVAEREAAGEN